jgi:outer membrane protein TolC
MQNVRFTMYLLLIVSCCQGTGCSGVGTRPESAAYKVAGDRPPGPSLGPHSSLAGRPSPEIADMSPRRLPPSGDAEEPVRFASLEDPLSAPPQPLMAPESAPGVEPLRRERAGARVALRPRSVEEALNPAEQIEPEPLHSFVQELDLTGALAIAGGQSPQIAFAAARYDEAYAQWSAARILWLPSLRAGVSFNHHDGPLQASSGVIDVVSRSALQAGLGVQAIGAGSPIVPGVVAQFHTADAIFQPRIAANAAYARSAATDAATNDTLMATALAYLELLRATQQLRIAEQTQENARKLAELTRTFAETGQGPQADADRTETELLRRRNDVSRAEEAVAVAGARLAEQLSLAADVLILPTENTIVPIELVCSDTPTCDLVATGLSNRPELAEAQHLVCEAVERYRREQFAPLVPSVLLGISESGYGGGLGSSIDDFGSRFDLDAVAFWELRNFGLGERARRQEMAARQDQAQALQVQVMDRVAREVVEAAAQVRARKSQIEVARQGIRAAAASYDRNLARIREGQGLPIEVLQSLQALDEAQRDYLRAVVDYNEAQFRLQRALGWPIQ